MAELLVKAVDAVGASGMRYLRGHPVVVMDDGHPWGAEERLPKFALFKFPSVTADRLTKYLADDTDPSLGITVPTIRRKWQIRWADLPLAARNTIKASGGLTILVPAFGYTGPFDYTWTQVKAYFHNNVTGSDETADIT